MLNASWCRRIVIVVVDVNGGVGDLRRPALRHRRHKAERKQRFKVATKSFRGYSLCPRARSLDILSSSLAFQPASHSRPFEGGDWRRPRTHECRGSS